MASAIRGAAQRSVNPLAQVGRSGGPDHDADSLVQFQPTAGPVDLAGWAAEHRDELQDALLTHGALLMRGFAVDSPLDFERSATAMAPEGLHGEYGDLPREPESGRLFSSTPYPEELEIHFHNESSHLPSWPRHILFYCATPADEGGETPLLDCRRLCQELDRQLVDEFADKGLRYTRNFSEGIDVRWQDFFGTNDPDEVASRCRAAGTEWEWLADGHLRTRQRSAAVRVHPRTGDPVFFNQVLLHHPAALPSSIRSALFEIYESEDLLPRSVSFGDGTPIPDEVIGYLLTSYHRLGLRFQWERNDVLMLDNMRMAHGRRPYRGGRRILVAMSDVVRAPDPAH